VQGGRALRCRQHGTVFPRRRRRGTFGATTASCSGFPCVPRPSPSRVATRVGTALTEGGCGLALAEPCAVTLRRCRQDSAKQTCAWRLCSASWLPCAQDARCDFIVGQNTMQMSAAGGRRAGRRVCLGRHGRRRRHAHRRVPRVRALGQRRRVCGRARFSWCVCSWPGCRLGGCSGCGCGCGCGGDACCRGFVIAARASRCGLERRVGRRRKHGLWRGRRRAAVRCGRGRVGERGQGGDRRGCVRSERGSVAGLTVRTVQKRRRGSMRHGRRRSPIRGCLHARWLRV
jgi:hypothetical protein